MKKILVCGSIAFDNIMDFPGLFKDQIVQEKIHIINISFLVNSLNKVRGGTAPNIAYSLALLGQKPSIVGTAGKDFDNYDEWLRENGIDTKFVRRLDDDYTATCYITTDLSNNQITGFYPGAMAKDIEIEISDYNIDNVEMVVIAPTEPKAMAKRVEECRAMSIPYMFDPGMQIPRLSAEELIEGIVNSKIAVFNEYEYNLMIEKTGLSREIILNSVDILVETLGGKGSILSNRKDRVHIHCAKPYRVVDPTGAGDAYRAGLIKGYLEGESLRKMGEYASVSAVYAVEHKGATEHRYSIDEYMKRYQENFR